MKIKIINPNTSEAMTRAIGAAGESVARPGTHIIAVSPRFGPASIESYYDDYLSIPVCLKRSTPEKRNSATPILSRVTATRGCTRPAN